MANGNGEDRSVVNAGVGRIPLGAYGSGWIEIGRDGRFYSLAINNNRRATSILPGAPWSFLAVRAASSKGIYARVLRENGGEASPHEPPGITGGLLTCSTLCPMAHFRLKDTACPLEIAWTFFAPIIPFDHEGSILPALFCSVQFTNPTDEPIETAVVFSWQNAVGHTGETTPESYANIKATLFDEKDDLDVIRGVTQPAKTSGEKRPRFNALEFGAPNGAQDADAQYFLVHRLEPGLDTSVAVWDPQDEDDAEAFWEDFVQAGRLPGRLPGGNEMARAGAVCGALTLPPGSGHRSDFILTWHAPHFRVRNADQGNGYTASYRDAVEVGRRCLRHVHYITSAVGGWQKSFISSSLPQWLSRGLIDSTHVFTTNSLNTRDGCCAALRRPEDPVAGDVVRRLFYSLGTMIFYPRFEELELAMLARVESPGAPGRIASNLGELCAHTPEFVDEEHLVDATAQFALTAYRNYLFTGKLPRIQSLYAPIEQYMAAALALDRDGDGLPEPKQSVTFDGFRVQGLHIVGASLWIAALKVCVRLAEMRGDRAGAARYNELFRKAVLASDRRYWDNEVGLYRLGPRTEEDPNGALSHVAQLAGQWYADLLDLGPVVHEERLTRVLETLPSLHHRAHGFVNIADPHFEAAEYTEGWPCVSAPMLASLMIRRDRVREGLALAREYVAHQYSSGFPVYDQPLRWNVESNVPIDPAETRSILALTIWHVFYAVQGLAINIREQRLRVAPNLPEGVHTLNAPLFTPFCVGYIRYAEDAKRVYRQQVRISFTSPMSLRTIELRVPSDVKQVTAGMMDIDDDVPMKCALHSIDGAQRLVISPAQNVGAFNAITIRVDGVRG